MIGGGNNTGDTNLAFLSAGTFGAWRCATALMLAAIVIDKRCRRRGGLSLMIYLASRHLPGIWALSRCSHGPGGREQSLVARPLSQLSLKRTRCDGQRSRQGRVQWLLRGNFNYFSERKEEVKLRVAVAVHSKHNNSLPRLFSTTHPPLHLRAYCSQYTHTLLRSPSLCKSHRTHRNPQGKHVIAQVRDSQRAVAAAVAVVK